MQVWQKTILNHHSNAVILNETQVKIPLVGYNSSLDLEYDDIITKLNNEYSVKVLVHDTDYQVDYFKTKSVLDYLGY